MSKPRDETILTALAKDGFFGSARIAQRWPASYQEVKARLEEMVEKGLVKKGEGPQGGLRFIAVQDSPPSLLESIETAIAFQDGLNTDFKSALGAEGVLCLIYINNEGEIKVEDVG